MKKIKINAQNIEEYIFPEFEVLKAFLSQFDLDKSLKLLLFLELFVKMEMKQKYRN